MRLLIVLSTTFITVSAFYDNFYFSSSASCPSMPYNCSVPNGVCAHESLLKKFYCCGWTESDICFTQGQTCGGEDSTPSVNQQQCGTTDQFWCCLKSEQCTPQTGQ